MCESGLTRLYRRPGTGNSSAGADRWRGLWTGGRVHLPELVEGRLRAAIRGHEPEAVQVVAELLEFDVVEWAQAATETFTPLRI